MQITHKPLNFSPFLRPALHPALHVNPVFAADNGTFKYKKDVASSFLRNCVEQYSEEGDVVVEIGPYNGANFLPFAEEFPNRKFIGIEIEKNSANGIKAKIRQQNLTNAFVYTADASDRDKTIRDKASLLYAGDGVASTMRGEDWISVIRNVTQSDSENSTLRPGAYIVFSVINRKADSVLQKHLDWYELYQGILGRRRPKRNFKPKSSFDSVKFVEKFLAPRKELLRTKMQTAALGCYINPALNARDDISRIVKQCEVFNNCELKIVEKRQYEEDELRVDIPGVESEDCYWVVLQYNPNKKIKFTGLSNSHRSTSQQY